MLTRWAVNVMDGTGGLGKWNPSLTCRLVVERVVIIILPMAYVCSLALPLSLSPWALLSSQAGAKVTARLMQGDAVAAPSSSARAQLQRHLTSACMQALEGLHSRSYMAHRHRRPMFSFLFRQSFFSVSIRPASSSALLLSPLPPCDLPERFELGAASRAWLPDTSIEAPLCATFSHIGNHYSAYVASSRRNPHALATLQRVAPNSQVSPWTIHHLNRR